MSVANCMYVIAGESGLHVAKITGFSHIRGYPSLFKTNASSLFVINFTS